MADDIIVLTGIKETIDALKEFDKAAARKFNKVINDELNRAEQKADNLVIQFTNPVYGTPMRGWRKTPATNPRTRGSAGLNSSSETETSFCNKVIYCSVLAIVASVAFVVFLKVDARSAWLF